VKLTKVQRTVLEKLDCGIIVCWGPPVLVWWDKSLKRHFTHIKNHTVEALERRGFLSHPGREVTFLINEAGKRALKGGKS